MNIKDTIALIVTVVSLSFGAWNWLASKEYVTQTQEPLKRAVTSLDANLKAQTAEAQQNRKIAARSLSLRLADDLTNMYNRLCYESLDAETKRRALEVVKRWEDEFESLTDRKYVPGECKR